MLKPRLPQSPAPPQSRVRIGTFVVDLSAREVFDERGGTRARITSKALAVVTELAVNPGQVLSRDDLMDRVWSGAFPTGDVLTQAVTALRKAFGDDAEAPRYIETISKSGYRLIAPVQWLAAQPRPATALGIAESAVIPSITPPTRSTRAGEKIWVGAATSIAAVLALVWAYWATSQKGASVDARAGSAAQAPLVIVAGAGDDWAPRLSPDGSMIVFSSSPLQGQSAQLFLQSSMVATPTPLTHPAAGEQDIVATWSPDGRHIAFQRHSDQAACKFMLVAATGGTPRQLGLCPSNIVLIYDWSPDGKHLVMGGVFDSAREGFGIQKFDIASGEKSFLDYPAPPGSLDLEPRYSPDGRWLAFRRNLSSADLWRMPSAGGAPERLTRITSDIRGFDWAPDGEHIVFSSNAENGMALFALDIASRKITPLGIENATFPDFPRQGNELIFELQHDQLSLVSLDLGNAGATGERVLASSGNESMGEVSPDKTALAFYSDRSGRPGVWLAPTGATTGAAQQVAGLVPLARFNPAWSPDSQRFLVIGFGDKGGGLYEVDRSSLRAQPLIASFGAPRFADYLKDGRMIVGSIESEQQSLWVVERQGNQLKPVRPKIDGVTYARVDHDNDRIFFVRIGEMGLWESDSNLQSVHKLFKSWPGIIGYKLWTLSEQRLWMIRMESSTNPFQLSSWSLNKLEGEPVSTRVLGDMDLMSVGAFSPGKLLFTESSGNGRDIGMLRYPQQSDDP
jgi:Tol biopolymer transport system component/DNA-binding winged helix-turn-helix (wHTH) protein